jgi:hypothetical protein
LHAWGLRVQAWRKWRCRDDRWISKSGRTDNTRWRRFWCGVSLFDYLTGEDRFAELGMWYRGCFEDGLGFMERNQGAWVVSR